MGAYTNKMLHIGPKLQIGTSVNAGVCEYNYLT